ncbi:TetR family transcriptional regulator [Leptolyngbya sp. 'hensonii']|nr:TetR family transcriptional regulator [Leptolyngbya sp. 'hensonii']
MTRSGNPIPNPEAASDKAEQVLIGAMQEFLKHGYAATSMDRVASAAGVSKATVYSHFQDKEGLFNALIKRLAEKKFAQVYGEQPLQGEPQFLLRQLAKKALDELQTDPEHLAFVRLVIGESGRFPQLAQTFVQNLAKPGIETMAHYLAAHPELNLPDPEAIARILVGSVVYFEMLQEMLHGKEILPMESDRLINALEYLLLGRCSPESTKSVI